MSKLVRGTVIYLDRRLPAGSSDLPEPRTRRADAWLCLVLQRVGFALPDDSRRPRCALTAPFHPYPAPIRTLHSAQCSDWYGAVYFLWHFPGDHSRWLLAITLPYAARTFLRHLRTGDRLAHSNHPLYYKFVATAKFLCYILALGEEYFAGSS